MWPILNGVEIASSNAPDLAHLELDGPCSISSSPVQATTYEDVDVSVVPESGTTGHLTATGNVLAIQTLLAPPAETISSITYSGTTATVTTTSANGYCTGDQVQIAGATPAQYDGLFTITVTGGQHLHVHDVRSRRRRTPRSGDDRRPTTTSLLVVPELCQMTSVIGGDFIYSAPTPGAANTLADVQPSIAFSTTDGSVLLPLPGDAHAQHRGHADLLHDRQLRARRASRRSAASPTAARRPR